MSSSPKSDLLTEDEIDAFAEILNIGIGRAANAMSNLLNNRIELSMPQQIMVRSLDALTELDGMSTVPDSTIIYQDFEGNIDGRASILFNQNSSLLLASTLAGNDEKPEELDVELSGILLEVGNIVLNSVMGSFSNSIKTLLKYSVPEMTTTKSVMNVMAMRNIPDSTLLIANVNFRVSGQDMHGSIMIVFSLLSVQRIVTTLLE
jgi:chemotaxis protein CheC